MKRSRWVGVVACAAMAVPWVGGSFGSPVQAAKGRVSGGGMVENTASSGDECYYRPGQLIAGSGQAAALAAKLGVGVGEITSLIPERIQPFYPPGVPKLSLYSLGGGLDPLSAAATLAGSGITAAPNYLSGFAPGGVRTWAPGEDRVAVPGPYPLVGAWNAGAGTRIGVFDTGLNDKLPTVVVAPGTVTYRPARALRADLASHGLVASGYVQPVELTKGRAAGHGTFITSLIRRAAPSTYLRVAQVPFYDATDESFEVDPLSQFSTEVTSRIDDAALTYAMYSNFVPTGGDVNVDVLSLSFGSYGCDEDFEPAAGPGEFRTPIGIRNGLVAMYIWSGGSLDVTAAAGNDLTDEEFYPAAFAANSCFDPLALEKMIRSKRFTCEQAGGAMSPWLASVRSTASKKGPYSNFGPWTNTEAQGSDVFGVVEDLTWASWSGTSFAAPCAAVVAAETPGIDFTVPRGLLDCGLG